MYAGVRWLVVSHGSVESFSAKEIITAMFRGIKEGLEPAGALETAREQIGRGSYASGSGYISRVNPYFW